MLFLKAEDLTRIHHVVADLFAEAGDPLFMVGPRSEALADAAVSRPMATFDGSDLFPNEREKAAVLVHAINGSHVFHDGNKRTSLAALVIVLDLNDWRLSCTDDELYDAILAVASTKGSDANADETIRELTSWIRTHSRKKQRGLGPMKVPEFLNRCEEAGGSYRRSGPSWVVTGDRGTIRISRSTRQLDQGVVRSYLSTIGLSEAWTGLSPDEFAEGHSDERTLIERYRGVLQRLADYDRNAED